MCVYVGVGCVNRRVGRWEGVCEWECVNRRVEGCECECGCMSGNV